MLGPHRFNSGGRSGDVRKRFLGTVAVVACIAGIPAGFAVGQALSDEVKPPEGPYKSAVACPEATALFKANGMQPDFFIPNCPGPEALAEMRSSFQQSPRFIAICRDEVTKGNASQGCERLLEVQAERRAAGK